MTTTMTHDSMWETVTLTTHNNEDTITVQGDMGDLSIDTLTTVTLKDNTCDTFTLDDIYLSDYGTIKNEIKVGDQTVTPELVEKMQALFDIIENMDDNNQIKQLFNTQISMNKIRGEHGDS